MKTKSNFRNDMGTVLNTTLGVIVGCFLDLLGMVVLIMSNQETMVQNNKIEFLLTVASLHLITLLLYVAIILYVIISLSNLWFKTSDDIKNYGVAAYIIVFGVAFLGSLIVTGAQPLIIDYYLQLTNVGRFGVSEMGVLWLINLVVTLSLGAIFMGIFSKAKQHSDTII